LRNPTPLFAGVAPYDPAREEILYGSTDVGDVSWITPTAQCLTACYAFGTPFHSWQMVSQGKLSAAHRGMEQAAKIMAATAIDLIRNPAVIEDAKAELSAYRNGLDYVCPIPADVELPFKRQSSK
jgi:aminobenzoyl-glutamate utilization protein B